MSRRQTQRERVLAAVRASMPQGRTVDELEVELHLPHQTCSPRVVELAKFSLIRDSGLRRTTRWGKEAIVYYAIDVAPKAPPPLPGRKP